MIADDILLPVALDTFIREHERHGGFDKQLKYSGDYELFIRARRRGSFLRIPRALSCVRRHGENMSMRSDAAQRVEIDAIVEQFRPSASWQRLPTNISSNCG